MELKIAVIDTMFSRGDMGKIAIDTLEKTSLNEGWGIKIVRRTVPGIKDIPLALLNLLEQGCYAGICLGFPGKMPIDKQCGHEASLGIQKVQLMTNKIVLEVFVHEDEGKDPQELASIMKNRSEKHAINLLWLLFKPEELIKRAGSGERQGKENAERVELQ